MEMKPFRHARERIAAANAVAVLTGAGISADSGIPTFRGEDGLWQNFRAEELATPEAFERDPRLVWEWYNWRRELIATKKPNAAHYALAELERRRDAFMLVTQNVDGLHVEAGSRNLIELHGDLWKVRCTKCGQVTENRDVPIAILPYCMHCNGLLRPNVVWFGEVLYAPDVLKSARAFEGCDLMLVIGTSGIVQPAASFVSMAKDHGAFVVEINVTETAASPAADALLLGRAAEVVSQLLTADPS
jgi:NAD-dependent protein deacetylase/lipoamidase